MLDHILRRVQAFEKRHGVTPNVVTINYSHFKALREQCPGLFSDSLNSDSLNHVLGFHLILVPDHELAQPRIGWIPPKVKTGYAAEPSDTATVLEIDQHRRAS